MTRRELVPALGAAALGAQGQTAISIGSRRELFVDRFLIDRLDGASLRLATPRREADAITRC